MNSPHLQCSADVLLSNGREESRVMDHPVHVLIDHDRVEVLQVQHVGIAIGTWSGGERGRVVKGDM